MKLYDELADWFHLLTAPSEYEEEAAVYGDLLVERATRPVRTVLELGSGGGNNASHLKARFTMVLTDLAPRMLEVSRGLNPECEHLQGDMRELRLGRLFDAVLIHDAASLLTSRDDVARSLQTAGEHCAPGGSVLVAPDYFRETFREGTSCGGFDGEGRALRYLEWTRDPDPIDDVYTVDFALLLREGEDVRVEQDRHHCGAFSRIEWLELLSASGFDAQAVEGPGNEAGAGAEVIAGVRRSS